MSEVAPFRMGRLWTYTCIVLNAMRSAVAGFRNKLMTGTTIVIHSEKEAFAINDTGSIT